VCFQNPPARRKTVKNIDGVFQMRCQELSSIHAYFQQSCNSDQTTPQYAFASHTGVLRGVVCIQSCRMIHSGIYYASTHTCHIKQTVSIVRPRLHTPYPRVMQRHFSVSNAFSKYVSLSYLTEDTCWFGVCTLIHFNRDQGAAASGLMWAHQL
jgi:hypothetical protein